MNVSAQNVKDRAHYQSIYLARGSLVSSTTVEVRTAAYLQLQWTIQDVMAHLRHLISLSATKALYE